jgi:hypothetical protein
VVALGKQPFLFIWMVAFAWFFKDVEILQPKPGGLCQKKKKKTQETLSWVNAGITSMGRVGAGS